MTLDLQKFYQACNPSKTLDMGNAEDQRYYTAFFFSAWGRDY
jgi:hypothetical protein